MRFEVVKLERNELPNLAKLFHLVWGGEASSIFNKTMWAFDNDRSYVLAAKSEDEIIAARGAIQWPLRNKDHTFAAYQLHGTCVHPDFRRLGIFSAINSEFLDQAIQNKFDVIFNVSVQASRLGYEKLGWKYLPGFRRLTRINHPFRAMKNVCCLKLPSITEFPPVSLIFDDFIFDDLLTAREEQFCNKIHSSITLSYLKWRLNNNAEGYRIIGNGYGCIIYKMKARGGLFELIIGDVFLIDNSKKLFVELVNTLLTQEAPDICTAYIFDNHPYYNYFLRSHFFANPFHYNLNFGVRNLSSANEKTINNRTSWAMSFLDIDTF